MIVKCIPMRWGVGNNYAYIVTDEPTRDSYIIDAGVASDVVPVIRELEESGDIKLVGIVNTHHHHDHSGANKELHEIYPSLPIIAGKNSYLVTRLPCYGTSWPLGSSLTVSVLFTQGHTIDSKCYYIEDKITNERVVFTGDTLFTAGCGDLNEGFGEDMNRALNKVLGNLPDDTVVYPGHEYTAKNVTFAQKILSNPDVDKLAKFSKENEYTTGYFTIGDEKKYNPFMRLEDPEVINYVGTDVKYLMVERLMKERNGENPYLDKKIEVEPIDEDDETLGYQYQNRTMS